MRIFFQKGIDIISLMMYNKIMETDSFGETVIGTPLSHRRLRTLMRTFEIFCRVKTVEYWVQLRVIWEPQL